MNTMVQNNVLAHWWVVIVAYNNDVEATQCAESWLAQSPRPSTVLIVENSDFPKVGAFDALDVVVISGHTRNRNSGSAGGFATGLDHCFAHQATHVILSDQDCLAQSGLVNALHRGTEYFPGAVISSLTVDPESGAFSPNLVAKSPQSWPMLDLSPDGNELVRSLGWTLTGERLSDIGALRAAAAEYPQPDFARVPLTTPQGLVVPREAYEAIGTIRREFFVGLEDHEYCARLHDAGVPILVALNAVGFHHLKGYHEKRLCGQTFRIFNGSSFRFTCAVRNTRTMASERATGLLLVRWRLHILYRCIMYLFFGHERILTKVSAILEGLVKPLRAAAPANPGNAKTSPSASPSGR
jgi:GT2 family glycosyltransferase